MPSQMMEDFGEHSVMRGEILLPMRAADLKKQEPLMQKMGVNTGMNRRLESFQRIRFMVARLQYNPLPLRSTTSSVLAKAVPSRRVELPTERQDCLISRDGLLLIKTG